MNDGHVVIVGAGQGGVQAALSLRQEGHGGAITLIGDEEGLPYQRPPLSKDYLKTGQAERLVLRPADYFDRKAINLWTGRRVDGIDRAARRVHVGQDTLAYDRLILATGTRNLIPPIPGIGRAFGLRTLAQAKRLRDALNGTRRIAVIGGGFIGLEVAAVARAGGHEVHVAEAAPRLMSRVLSPQMSERFRAKHEALGTRFHLGNGVTELRDGCIVLASGETIDADLVLLAAGVRPNTELAEAAGLAVDNGVVVDPLLRTSDPEIYALGDCCAFPDPGSGNHVRLESVQAATDQARAIARTIVHGAQEPYAKVPWFWSDRADWKLQIAGLADPDATSVTVGEDTVFRFSGNRLCAVETINNAKVHMQARKVLARRPAPAYDDLARCGFDLGRETEKDRV